MSEPVPHHAYVAKDCWVTERQSDGVYTYLWHYRDPGDAKRATRDLNTRGVAESPAYYERTRGRRG